jgi:sugar lactone lactonase YvrE
MRRLLLLALLLGGCRLGDRFHGGATDGGPDLSGAGPVDFALSTSTDLAQPVAGPDLAQPACAAITVSTLSGNATAGLMDGASTVAEFNRPEGITVDPTSGDLYVADFTNARVRKVLADGTTSSFAVSTGTNLDSPLRIVYVAQNLFVADSTGDGLIEVTPSGGVSRAISLGGIQTVAAMADNSLFVGDTSQIYKYGSTPVHYSGTTTGGFHDGASTVAQFANISDLVFDATGKLYVADAGNFRVRVVASDGSATTLAGSTMGHTDGPGTTAQLAGPTGLAIDNTQHLIYVADGTTIRVIAADGTTSTLVGSTAGFMDGSGCVAKFTTLRGIALFGGALYASDLNRIRKIVLP